MGISRYPPETSGGYSEPESTVVTSGCWPAPLLSPSFLIPSILILPHPSCPFLIPHISLFLAPPIHTDVRNHTMYYSLCFFLYKSSPSPPSCYSLPCSQNPPSTPPNPPKLPSSSPKVPQILP